MNVPDDYSDAALVLVGHGSTLNAESSSPTFQHADEIRRRGLFGQVLVCFWKEEPGLAAVLRGVFARRVFVVPLFISEGYFTEEVIPRELGFTDPVTGTVNPTREHDGRILYYCGPVGTHDSMTESLLARAAEILEQFPFPSKPRPTDVSLFIAGHGTGNNANSRKAIERHAARIRERGIYADVHAVFMEEAPRVEDCYSLATKRNVIMVPFFISDGLHSYEDIPVLLGEPEATVRKRLRSGQATWRNPTERKGKRVWYTQSIGNETHIPDVILERVRERTGETEARPREPTLA